MLTQLRWLTSSEYPPDKLPYESLKKSLTELYTLNPFQRYQELMSLTLAADKKPSKLMRKMLSLLPLSHRVHKGECFLFKGFFLDHLPPNVRTHLMKEDISDPRKLAAKADKIWQSSSTRSVNTVSATSLAPPVYDDSVNSPRPTSSILLCFPCCSSFCSPSFTSSILQYNL